MRSRAGNASTTFGRAAAVFDLITSSTSGQLDRDTADHHGPPTPSIDDDPTQRRGATRSDHRAILAAGCHRRPQRENACGAVNSDLPDARPSNRTPKLSLSRSGHMPTTSPD